MNTLNRIGTISIIWFIIELEPYVHNLFWNFEAYDENDNLLSKTKERMTINYLKQLTEFKLND